MYGNSGVVDEHFLIIVYINIHLPSPDIGPKHTQAEKTRPNIHHMRTEFPIPKSTREWNTKKEIDQFHFQVLRQQNR